MNRNQWLEAGNAILAQAKGLLLPWGVQVDPVLIVREDHHPCPGYLVREKCIVFCPPVTDTRIERLRWLMHRRVMGCETIEEAARFYEIALPYIICHELSHHLRFAAQLASPSMFVEEEACDQVCVAMLDAVPRWRADLASLRKCCLRMSGRLASVVQTDSDYLPSAGDVLVMRKRLSRSELDDLEQLAVETGTTSDALLRLAGGEQAGAMQAAHHSRELAEEYIDSRYTDDAPTYWALKLAWLAAWLERAQRPDLPQMLREHILKPRHASSDTAIIGALRTVMRSNSAAQALNTAPPLGTRVAAAEGFLSLAGRSALPEFVEIALRSNEPDRFARMVLSQHHATAANRELLLPLARNCLRDFEEAPARRLETGALLAIGIGELALLQPLANRAQGTAVLAAILQAANSLPQPEVLPEPGNARAAFLHAWRLAGRSWTDLPDSWRDPLLQLDDAAAREIALTLVDEGNLSGLQSILSALDTRLRSDTARLHKLARRILTRDKPLAVKLLAENLPGRGTPEWDNAASLAQEFGPVPGARDALRGAALKADLLKLDPLNDRAVATIAESRCQAIAGLLWVERQLADAATIWAPLRELAVAATGDAARLQTLELIASIAPLTHAREVRRMEQGVLTRRELAAPLLNILSGVLPGPWQTRIRPLLAGKPSDIAPQKSDLPPIILWLLAAIALEGAGDLSPWLDTLELPEDKSVLDSVEKMVHLRSVPLFEGLDAEALRALAERALEQTFEPGAAIVTEGEPGDRLYIVLTGRAQARSQGHVLGELGPQQVFGEMSLLDGSPRTATVCAQTACRLLTLSRADLRPVAQRNPVIYEELLLALAAKLRAANLRENG